MRYTFCLFNWKAVAGAAFAWAVPLWLAGCAGDAAPRGHAAPPGVTMSPAAPGAIAYDPPDPRGPKTRVDGVARAGPAGLLPAVYVLAPEHLSNSSTTHERPSLFWYLPKQSDVPIRVTLTRRQDPAPVLQLDLTPPEQTRAGLHRLDLADRRVPLTIGVPYEWAVALTPGGKAGADAPFTKSTIKRVMATQKLTAKLAKAGADRQAAVRAYAEEGFWYDAVDALSDLIETNPADPALRLKRAGLLLRENLPVPAADDDRAAKALAASGPAR